MAKFNDAWTVQPHGPVEEVDEGILTVAGEIVMPLGRFPRRMTVVRLADGGTAIWSAIPLAEPEMARIEALGPPSFLVVPGVAHRLDVRAWKARYPAIRVLSAAGARDAVDEAVTVDEAGDVLDDPQVALESVPGTGDRELSLRVDRAGGTTLLLNDVLANVRHPNGFGAWAMARLFGFGVDGPRVPRPVIARMVTDRTALAGAFRGWADLPRLKRILVSHGDPIADTPAAALLAAAAQLER
ncbi:hypothetical protein [Sphingomonas sp.]|uniref:hypothetical protein n=1 Tax=Sphingomonas sp. TaxID=28214 RepID=UPI001B0A7122|nr:hypothetical protein [Sphingomonas sp.]MBO9714695.1 hypothetical protein [Sphingomonas sp.]